MTHTAVRDRLPEIGPAVAAAVAVTGTVAFALQVNAHLVDAQTRAGVETAITLVTMAAAVLLGLQFRRQRQVYSLLLLSALLTVGVTDLLFSALPALGGFQLHLGSDASLVSQMLVPLTFAAAAVAGRRRGGGSHRRTVIMVASACLGTLLLVEVLDLFLGRAGGGSAGSPAALALNDLAAAVFVATGLVFARRVRPARAGDSLLAGACFLLAAGRLQELAIPVVPPNWVTFRELLRLLAYGLLLTASVRAYAEVRRADEQAELRAQRERIARDLHDGLAQDLAVIAMQSQRLAAGLGQDHPITIAARRALAASRSTIVDLSASTAPSTAVALRDVADELELKFGIDVTVTNELDRRHGVTVDLDADAREHFVRIAREAIVNAARHGHARHVDVIMRSRGPRWMLRISDDGVGIEEAQLVSAPGFGLRAMRARADELGGRLSAERRASGGTVLELLLAAPPR
ncbi:MAG TPA: ATP-binding protein [Solirubrobacteraceae bacterium]